MKKTSTMTMSDATPISSVIPSPPSKLEKPSSDDASSCLASFEATISSSRMIIKFSDSEIQPESLHENSEATENSIPNISCKTESIW